VEGGEGVGEEGLAGGVDVVWAGGLACCSWGLGREGKGAYG
jgi:hypothetical protein